MFQTKLSMLPRSKLDCMTILNNTNLPRTPATEEKPRVAQSWTAGPGLAGSVRRG